MCSSACKASWHYGHVHKLNRLRNNQTVRHIRVKAKMWSPSIKASKFQYQIWKWIFFAILAFAIIEEMAFARISLQIPYSFILPAILLGKTVLRYVFEAAWSKFWKSSLEKFSCYWKYWKKFFKSQMTLLWHVCNSQEGEIVSEGEFLLSVCFEKKNIWYHYVYAKG